MFWFFIWFLCAVFLFTVVGWSTNILFQQKRAWAAFAAKYGLAFEKGTFFGSPGAFGQIDGTTVRLFHEEKKAADPRARRVMTVVEMERPLYMPAAGLVGTGGALPFVQSIGLTEAVPLPAEWNQAGYIAYSHNAKILSKFLTADRMAVIKGFFDMKFSAAFLIFDGTDLLIRVETTDPIAHPKKIDLLFRKMQQVMASLQADGDEKSRMIKLAKSKDHVLPDDVDEETLGFEFEDAGVQSASSDDVTAAVPETEPTAKE